MLKMRLAMVVSLLLSVSAAAEEPKAKPAASEKAKATKLEEQDRKELMLLQLTAENAQLKQALAEAQSQLQQCQMPKLNEALASRQKALAAKYGIDFASGDQVSFDGAIVRHKEPKK